ncbi:MAG: translational machinery protein [Burkholderiaceae bacterium]|nr:translational machinery protein [Burkholderiaceae bacterium]
MDHNHAVIWIDHQKAHVMSFNKEDYDETIVHARPHSHSGHLHIKSGVPGSGHAQEDTAFFDATIELVKDVPELLVVGPGMEKSIFVKYVAKTKPHMADKIVGVEAIDHPSDPQLLAYARKYFVKTDLFH